MVDTRSDERAALLPPAVGSKSDLSGPSHHNLAGYSATRFRLTAASIWCCTFFAAFDNTVLATLTSTISSRFAAANQGAWLGTAYLLSSCCFTPIYGRLADIFGRRAAHMVATFWFILGTALCTIAPSMHTLIAARFIAGIGGGGVQSMAVIILTDLVDLRYRGLFQGYANIVFGLGSGLGGPVGGWVSDTFGWRAAFGMQVPLLLVGAVLTFGCLTGDLGGVEAARVKAASASASVSTSPSSSDSTAAASASWKGKLKQIDYLGSATLVLAVASLILGLSLKTSSLTSSGSEYFWTDPHILGLLLASLLFTLAFLYVEARIAPAPVLPFSLLRRRTPASVAASLAIVAASQFSLMYNVPLFFTAVKLDSASVAGAHLLPYSVLVGVGSLSVGYIIRRTGRYWWTCVGSGIVVLVSAAALCFWGKDSPEWFTWIAQAPSGFGYAGVLTGTLVALMTDVTIAGKGEV